MGSIVRGVASVVTLVLAWPAFAVLVPGTSNPWLAGMPDGSTACGKPFDFAPAQSPVLFDLGPVSEETFLTFTVTGSTDHGGPPFGLSPDGGPLQPHVAENGIAGFDAPISALVAVFLDDQQPNLTSTPADFDLVLSAPAISPGLKQAFFIGDGLTGTGSGDVQKFFVPAGATRLFLGTQDGCGWANNGGSFTVDAAVVTPCPWDINGDGHVDHHDLLEVVHNMGPCDGCPEDVNGDGVVNGKDVAAVATHFGPCP